MFVAVTDSPGVTLRLQCTIRHHSSHPRRLPGRVTAQSNNPSETQRVSFPGDSPCGVYSLSSGAELGNSASGHAVPLSLWMLIITLQLLQCCSWHYGFFLGEIKSWLWVSAFTAEPQWISQHSLPQCTSIVCLYHIFISYWCGFVFFFCIAVLKASHITLLLLYLMMHNRLLLTLESKLWCDYFLLWSIKCLN